MDHWPLLKDLGQKIGWKSNYSDWKFRGSSVELFELKNLIIKSDVLRVTLREVNDDRQPVCRQG